MLQKPVHQKPNLWQWEQCDPSNWTNDRCWPNSAGRDCGDHFKVVGLKIWPRQTSIRGHCSVIYRAFGVLKNQPKQKSGRAIALPTPPPPQSLAGNQHLKGQVSVTEGEDESWLMECTVHTMH